MTLSEIVYVIVFATLIVFALILALIIVIVGATRKEARQQVTLARTKLEYESELRTIESEVQEHTLTHLSEELHDNIGQLLAVMNVQLEKEKMRQPEIVSTLSPISATLQSTMEQVRLLSHSLSNDFITERGLQQSIMQEVERLQAIGRYNIHFESDGTEPSISKDARTVAFRIFQESISNALKHAKPKNIYVDLNGYGTFALQVRDDGKGFDKEAAMHESRGLGLKNMVRRAALAGLSCEIKSADGKGACLRIFVLDK